MTDMKKIVCYGDSNTWGACGFSGARRDKERRWTGILDAQPDYKVINYGENGREIPHNNIGLAAFKAMTAREAPFDLLIVMLGTNDLFNMPSSGADNVTKRMEDFLRAALSDPAIDGDGRKILLIAPPPTQIGRAWEDGQFDEVSRQLGQRYEELAKELGVNFADAGRWGVEPGPDGVHFTEEGHRAFAAGLEKELQRIFN